MDPMLFTLFHHQIWTQCKFARLAYDELGTRIAEQAQKGRRSDPRYMQLANLPREELIAQAMEIAMEGAVQAWHPIQALLTAVANISKALWGQGGKRYVERQPLRDSLGVDDSSPLRPTSMRNNFDHFDERLDDWWQRSATHNYIDLSFGDMASATKGAPEDEMFRSYDPRTGDLVFWGQRYNLPSIIGEINRIMPLALREASK